MSKSGKPKTDLRLPTSPQSLQLETVHQIADDIIHFYSKGLNSFFHCGWVCSLHKSEALEEAKKMKAMTSETFNPKQGWLTIADAWLKSHHHIKDLIHEYINSAFHYMMRGVNSPSMDNATYNGFTILVEQTFNSMPVPCPTILRKYND